MDDRQPIIDNIVEEFSSGNRAIASALYEEHLFDKEGGAPEEFEFCGTVVPAQYLHYDSNDYDRLEGFVSDDRLTELSNDAEATEEENEEYRKRILAQVEDGCADADVIPGYWVRRLRHTDGREVFALETVKGYSFSGVANTFHGVFPVVDDAFKDLATWGVVMRE